MMRKTNSLRQQWDDICELYPDKSDEWRMQMTLDVYNASHKNRQADHSDLIEALERGQD
jgi:hypothetical protein